MPSALPRPITGMPWAASGRWKQASTPTSRNPARTMFGKAASSSTPPENTTVCVSTARKGAVPRCLREAIQKLREGAIGEVYMARGLCYKWRPTIGKAGGPQATPPGVDYNLWCGPAPKKPLQRKKLHYDWHWQWDCGNGDMGNQGVHEMDMARWGLGVGLPTRITGTGGHYMFDDDQQTPNALICTFDYPEQKKMLQFETRHWVSNYEGGFGASGENNVGVLFFGSEGYMEMEYFAYRIFLGQETRARPQGHRAMPILGRHSLPRSAAAREKTLAWTLKKVI